MGKSRQNQTPEGQQTDTLAMEDETLNSNKAAQTIPLSVGQAKTALRWITPLYGLRVTKTKSSSGKGGK